VASAGIDWHPSGFARELLNGRPPPPATSPPREVWGASASAALFRRELFDSVGMFDESFFAYQEDVELALRAHRAGWKCVMAPAARGLHLGFGSNRPFAAGGSYADYFNARNRLVLLVTTLPTDDWRRHWREMLVAQLRLLTTSLPEGRAGAVWAGVLHGLWRVPRALRARRRVSDAISRTADRRCP
jgi:GT2 family glycosyltransferase